MKTNVRDLKTGDSISIGGGAEIVQSLAYGDGLVAYQDKVAKPVIVAFFSGRIMKVHPGRVVNVERGFHHFLKLAMT